MQPPKPGSAASKRASVRRLAVAGVGIGIVVAAALVARRALGIELDPDSIRDAVAKLGVFGPLAFVLIVTFRVPLGIPSQVALIGGGAVFGLVPGTIYGGLGILFSGSILFLTSRWAGREAVTRRVPARMAPLVEVASSRIGGAFLAVGTGYPFGPITVYHALAGLTAMSFGVFAVAVAGGALVRSATFTFLGDSLVEGGTPRLVQAACVLALAVLVPLLFPRSRQWVREMVGRGERRDAGAGGAA